MTPPRAGRAAGDANANANGDGKISREKVLAAALDIIDRDSVDGLSTRRLARALDRDPMILYRHAPNKAALLDGVAETVLAKLTVDVTDPDWAGQLRSVARSYRALALAHPHGAVAGNAAPGHTASAAPSWHTAPARGRPRAAHPRWL